LKYFTFYYLVLLHNEALDIEGNVVIPGEATQQEIIPLTHSTTDILIPKSTDPVRPGGESDDEDSA
jgi:hypothetical protein